MKSQDSVSYYNHHALRLAKDALQLKNPADLLPFLELLNPKSRVLDLGCGSGMDLFYLKRAGHDLVGLDASPKLVEIARAQNPGAEIQEKNFLFLNLKEGEWDGIWANNSLHHYESDMVQRVVAVCFKGLKTTGALGLVVFEGTESFDDREGDLTGPARSIRPYTEKAICSMLEQTGFKIMKVGRKPAENGYALPRLLILATKV
jgi:SAM-dependent methyltransferase